MKKLLLILTLCFTLSTTSAQAQNWLDALKSVATSAIDKVTGGQLTAKRFFDRAEAGMQRASQSLAQELGKIIENRAKK